MLFCNWSSGSKAVYWWTSGRTQLHVLTSMRVESRDPDRKEKRGEILIFF